jgi:hypothetical protein
MPTFSAATSHEGSLSGLSDVEISTATIQKMFRLYNTTASGDGRNAEATAAGRYFWAMSGEGWYKVAGVYPKLVAQTVVSGLVSQVTMATIQKQVVLRNVTGAADAAGEAQWSAGVKTYGGQLAGWLADTEQPMEDTLSPVTTLTLPLGNGGGGTVTGAALVSRVSVQPVFRDGAAIGQTFGYQYRELVTAGGPFATESFTASIVLDNGQTMSGTYKIRNMSVQLDYAAGAPVPVRFSGVFDGTVSFA